MQHPQSQADHLQILASSCRAYVPRLRTDIVHYGLLQPWNQKMCAFVDDTLFDTRNSVEDDGSCTAFDVVEGGLDPEDDKGHGECVSENAIESVRHIERVLGGWLKERGA